MQRSLFAFWAESLSYRSCCVKSQLVGAMLHAPILSLDAVLGCFACLPSMLK